MGRKLISLSFKPSTELPETEELKTFLATDFGRQVPGFTVLDSPVKWSDATLDLLGKDANGRLVALFAAASGHDRGFHGVMAQALVASTWLEENKDDVRRAYGERGADPEQPLRLILVAPAASTPSRTLGRALERAGVETMLYALYEIETGEGPLLAVSFDGGAAPASAAPAPPAPAAGSVAATPAAEPRDEAHHASPEAPATAVTEPEPPRADPMPEAPAPPRPPSAVEIFIASMADPNIKAMSEQIFTFLLKRFPAAEGIVSPQDRGFTLRVGGEHLATIRLDRGALWLEVGPERIPTNKIKDPATLERAMNLPSVLDALGSVQPA
jgi:hypothetical protein